MKIVLVCRVHPIQRPGGMPFVLEDRSHALAAVGHEVIVLTTGKYAQIVQGDVLVEQVGCPFEVYSQEFAAKCLERVKYYAPEVVHLDSLDVNRPWWTFLTNIKTACTLHGFAWGAFFTNWNLYRIGKYAGQIEFNPASMLKERNAIASFDVVFGICRHEYRMLRDLFGIAQVQLLYNPIADYFFYPTTAITSNTYLCAAISGHSTRLFDTIPSEYKIKVVSKVPRIKMPQEYDSSCGIIVPTAYSQGYDLTVAESLARGRPVITSDVGSYLEESYYADAISVFNLGDLDSLRDTIKNAPRQVDTSADYVIRHRPDIHATNWLAKLTS